MKDLKGKDGSYLHTVRFPCLTETKKATVVFFHSFGAYTEKAAGLAQNFQKQGYEVIGMDMRAFGQTQTAHPGLIDDPSVQLSDSSTFLRAYREQYDDGKPLVIYGYSLGATYALGTYFSLEQDLKEEVKALVVVSPQTGMGDYWYPDWYRPRKGRLLSLINWKWGAFPPLVSMRDRHDELQYKGPVYARTLWTVQDWTDRNLAMANQI